MVQQCGGATMRRKKNENARMPGMPALGPGMPEWTNNWQLDFD